MNHVDERCGLVCKRNILNRCFRKNQLADLLAAFSEKPIRFFVPVEYCSFADEFCQRAFEEFGFQGCGGANSIASRSRRPGHLGYGEPGVFFQ